MEEIIKKYMEQRANEDPTIAANLLKPTKSWENCFKYINAEARKLAVNGCAFVEDQIVYGWAVHYWDEDGLDVDKPKPQPKTEKKPTKGATNVVTMKPTTTTTKTADKPQNEAKKPTIVQLDLF